MNATNAHVLSILRASRDELVERSTEIALASGEVPIPRNDLEQMLRACVALLEEGLAGESDEIRSGFLEALTDVARTSTWDSTVRAGVPCWGVITCLLVARANKEHQEEAIQFLSRFMGNWWADVSKKMLPVAIAENKL